MYLMCQCHLVCGICSTKHFILKACQCPIPTHGYIKLFYFLKLLHASTCQCCVQCLYLAYATSNTSYWRCTIVRHQPIFTLNCSIFSNYYTRRRVSVVSVINIGALLTPTHVGHHTRHVFHMKCHCYIDTTWHYIKLSI
jgi:hypothetical protein